MAFALTKEPAAKKKKTFKKNIKKTLFGFAMILTWAAFFFHCSCNTKVVSQSHKPDQARPD
jgi:hypothetical protein